MYQYFSFVFTNTEYADGYFLKFFIDETAIDECYIESPIDL